MMMTLWLVVIVHHKIHVDIIRVITRHNHLPQWRSFARDRPCFPVYILKRTRIHVAKHVIIIPVNLSKHVPNHKFGHVDVVNEIMGDRRTDDGVWVAPQTGEVPNGKLREGKVPRDTPVLIELKIQWKELSSVPNKLVVVAIRRRACDVDDVTAVNSQYVLEIGRVEKLRDLVIVIIVIEIEWKVRDRNLDDGGA